MRPVACSLLAIFLLIGCGSSFAPSTDAYCSTDDRTTACRQGEVLFQCLRGAEPVTDGTCRHILASKFAATSLTAAYTEVDYCCSDTTSAADAGAD